MAFEQQQEEWFETGGGSGGQGESKEGAAMREEAEREKAERDARRRNREGSKERADSTEEAPEGG